MNTLNDVFGRPNNDGHITILTRTDGEPVRSIVLPYIYPVNSNLSCMYEHPRGIRLTRHDCTMLGIEVEE